MPVIDWANLGAIDWVIVVVLTLSTLLSLWRGFMREALSLAGWVAAFVVANIFADDMARALSGLINNVTGRYVAAYAILFVGTLVTASILTRLAVQLVKVSGLSLLDRLLGTVFVLRQLVPPQELQWLDNSQLMPHLNMLSQWAQGLFSEFNGGQLPKLST